MTIHLRQICLVANKLAPAIEDLKEVFSVKPCFVDPGVEHFGLENTLLAVGTDFLEVVAPVEENTTAGRYLERRGGDGGYMVIVQVATKTEVDDYKQRAADNQVRVAFDVDREGWRILQLHPGDMRASFLDVEWVGKPDFEGTWHAAGGEGWKDKIATDVVAGYAGVELQGPDPMALAKHWGAVTGIEVEQRNGMPVIPLANAELRFVEATDGRGPGLGGVDLRVADRARLLAQAKKRGCYVSDDQVLVCGTRFNLLS